MGQVKRFRRFSLRIAPFLLGLGLATISPLPVQSQVCPSPAVYNLPYVKQQLKGYYDSGLYLSEVAAVVEQGKQYLNQRAGQGKKLAVVLDIDETSLSNWESIESLLLRMGLGTDPKSSGLSGNDPALQPTLDLYRLARQKGFWIFFITGRPDTPSIRQLTEANLRRVGYEQWQGLYMKPVDYHQSSVVGYKSETRAKIAAAGYQIVLNLGDQYSDLEGGYAERVLKLPNPFYFIP